MRKLAPSLSIAALFFGASLLAGVAQPQTPAPTRPPELDKLAKTYGMDTYDQAQAFRYTFNIELPALKLVLARTWTWEVKTGQVTYESKDKEGKPVKVTYNRNQLNGAPENVKNDVEPAFVNDNYWFMFPFHAYWDKSATVSVKEKQKLPIGAGIATLLSVKYPAEVGGYTPGDTWDLYVGADGRIVQFVYHRGGPKPPQLLAATWAGYKKAGPLLVSTEHRGTADGKPAHIFFTNVAYKVAGSDAWMDAK